MDLSPDGSIVYVGGERTDGRIYQNFVTLAYDATDGTALWDRGYAGPGKRVDQISAIDVGSTGTVFVTGPSDGTAQGAEYATIAYDGVTGTRVWVRRYTGPVSGGPNDMPADVATDPASERVFVTGWSDGFPTFRDYATVAYPAA